MLFDFSQDPDIDSHLFYDQKYLNRTACVPCEKSSLQKLNFYGFSKKLVKQCSCLDKNEL